MKRKYNKYIIYTLIACFVTTSYLLPLTLKTAITRDPISTPKMSAVHPIIDIGGDTELDTFCNASGTDGLSWATAHVIENYEIDGLGGHFCIHIASTTRFLIIRNCEVFNLTVDPTGWCAGIYVHSCQNIRITDNYAHDSEEAGIYARNSNTVNISDNRVTASAGGVGLVSSENCLVSKNTISEGKTFGFDYPAGWGITLYQWGSFPVSNNIVIDNTVSNCPGDGIWLYHATDNNITSNKLSNNGYYGIYATLASDNNDIHNNYFCNNAKGAILDEGAGNNISGSTNCTAIPGYSLVWILGIISIVSILEFVKISMTQKKRNHL